MYGANTFYKTDYQENPLLTDNRMAMYAWWFESKCAEFSEIKTFSLSNKSLAIPGIKYFSVENLLKSAEQCKIDFFQILEENNQNEKKQEQFSALTYNLYDKNYFIAYRGTDDTIIGWKEDFNLAIKDVVPAQKDAVVYLENVADKLKGSFFIGGHSKGGNLAIYATAMVSSKIKKHVEKIYNFDGPGFSSKKINSPEFTEIIPKIKSYFPHFAIIGMVFYRAGSYSIVDSSESGMMQHDPMSWNVCGNKFIMLENFHSASEYLSKTLNSCIDQLEQNQIELLIETIFEIIQATNAKTNSDLEDNLFQNSKKIIAAVTRLDSNTRKAVEKIMKQILKIAKNQLPEYNNYFELSKRYLETKRLKGKV